MSSWSQQRKFFYGGTVAVVVIGGIALVGFSFFYKAPTCSDGIMNGNELGVDCGGSCQRLCQSAFLPPSVSWTRFEKVAPGLYNVAAYIVNQNIAGEAVNVPYHMVLYDSDGILITEYNDTLTLPPNRNTLAFRGVVSAGQRIPVKALFQFTAAPDWHKQIDRLPSLVIADKKYLEDEAGSSLTVTLKNTGVLAIGRTSVYAILYDKDGNAIGFSKTIVDSIPAKGTTVAPFTWPVNRSGAVISIDILPVSE